MQQLRRVILLLLAIVNLFSIPGRCAPPEDVPETFYPFGEVEGDSVAPVNDDGSTERIPIWTEFPFFDHLHDSLFVNTNGVVSFLREVSQYTPDAFPLGDDRRLIAPFWADVDTLRNGGRAFYRQTTDSEILARATQDIRDTFVDQPRFEATWVFVSTWYRVTYYGGHTRTAVNSFQVVLVTNGRHSFTIFNYGDIKWTTGTASGGAASGLGGTSAQVGFNAGDNLRHFNLPGSRQPDIVNVETTSNVGSPGRWVFRTDNADVEDGGCNTAGRLTVDPRFGSPLGGQRVTVAGPCLEVTDTITCLFDDVETSGHVVNNIRASCVSPLLLKRGRISLAIAVNGGNYSHHGTYILVDQTPEVNVAPSDTWRAGRSPVKIEWDYSVFNSTSVDVDLVAFQIVDGKDTTALIPLATRLPNSGKANLPATLLTGTSFWVDIGAIRVREAHASLKLNVECVWSEMHIPKWYFNAYVYELVSQKLTEERRQKRDISETVGDVWDRSNAIWENIDDVFDRNLETIEEIVSASIDETSEYIYGDICKAWYQEQIDDPPIIDVPPCPCDTNQLMAETATFEPDDACNMGKGCGFHSGAFHCVRSRNPSPSGAGQQCCYSKPTESEPGTILPFRLSNGQLAGGTYDRAHVKGHFSSGKIPYLSHFWQDVKQFFYCCSLSHNCDKYSEVRYTDDCSDYEPPRPAVTMGDPHIYTLDGTPYTFNGLGEYTVLHIEGAFDLQGRTQQVIETSGEPVSASMWTAVAMQSLDEPSDTVQVETNERQPLQVLINGQIEVFDDLPQQEFNGVDVAILENVNTTVVQISFASGVYVKVTSVEDSLQFLVVLPSKYRGQTQGLLGTWNDDQGDDFLTPDGDSVSADSSMEEIHNFGQLWQTNSNSSLFTYEMGESHEDFKNPNFSPSTHLDNVDPDVIAEATIICGDSLEAFQCVFDYATTRRKSFAMATNSAKDEYLQMVSNTQNVVTCGFLTTPVNGQQEASNYFSGAAVTFTCHEGYGLMGSPSRTCGNDGVWSGTEAKCVGGGGQQLDLWMIICAAAGGVILLLVVVGVIVAFTCRTIKKTKQHPAV